MRLAGRLARSSSFKMKRVVNATPRTRVYQSTFEAPLRAHLLSANCLNEATPVAHGAEETQDAVVMAESEDSSSCQNPKLNSHEQRFALGSCVLVARRDGSKSFAVVVRFEVGLYEVAIIGSDAHKRCYEGALLPAPHAAVQEFAMDAAVLVLRSSGAESLAFVRGFDPSGLYTLELEAEGSGLRKRSLGQAMRLAPGA